MFEVTILIPVADNAGSQFAPAHHAAFESFVLVRFGGLSRQASTLAGLWVDQGLTFADENIVYRVAVVSIIDGGKLGEVVDFAKRHYQQRAIYVAYLGVAEIL